MGALSACSPAQTTTATTTEAVPISAVTQAPPTATPLPAAVIVNGERLDLAFFESELARFVTAQETANNPVEDEKIAQDLVLEDLIDRMLLAQFAEEQGLAVEDSEVEARLQALATDLDLDDWMSRNSYTREELSQALRLDILAVRGRDRVIAEVPQVMEQVELRQVFAYTEAGAKNALLSLTSGKPFEEVAQIYDPVTGGYLGWTPRGYLLVPAVEEAAFSLPVGGYSDIIESDVGYHIVRVLAREERPLSQDALLTLQRQALTDWLVERRAVSAIEILVN